MGLSSAHIDFRRAMISEDGTHMTQRDRKPAELSPLWVTTCPGALNNNNSERVSKSAFEMGPALPTKDVDQALF